MNKCEEILKKNLEEKRQIWSSPDACHMKYEQIYFKPTIIAAVRYWCLTMQTDQRNRVENPVGISSQWEKECAIQEMVLGFHEDYFLIGFDFLKH